MRNLADYTTILHNVKYRKDLLINDIFICEYTQYMIIKDLTYKDYSLNTTNNKLEYYSNAIVHYRISDDYDMLIYWANESDFNSREIHTVLNEKTLSVYVSPKYRSSYKIQHYTYTIAF